MTTVRFLDTNILLYSISGEPSERRKRDTAIALLDHDDLALSVQVLQEFYVQATRPTRTTSSVSCKAWRRSKARGIKINKASAA